MKTLLHILDGIPIRPVCLCPNRLRTAMMAMLLCLICAQPARPHANSVSYSDVTIEDRALTYNMMTYVQDLWQLVWIDENNDGMVDVSEVEQNQQDIVEYVTDKIFVYEGEEQYAPTLTRFETVTDTSYGYFQVVGVDIDFRFEKPEPWDGLMIACTLYDEVDYLHQSFAIIRYGERSREFVFFNDNVYEAAEIMEGPWADAVYYLRLGGEDLLTGAEVMVFLVVLLVAAGRRRDVLRSFVSFGLAVSLTCWLAATEKVLLDARFVEAAIGLTIAYLALENLLTKDDAWRWLMTGFFGLVYGFDFAATLRYIGLAPEEGSIAIGMYLAGIWGSLALCGVVGAVLVRWGRSSNWYDRLALKSHSAAAMVLGMAWCYEKFTGEQLLAVQGWVRVLVVWLVAEAIFLLLPTHWFETNGDAAQVEQGAQPDVGE